MLNRTRPQTGWASANAIRAMVQNNESQGMENLIAFLLAGLALTGSPGPATLGMAAMGAAFGARRGLGFMAGAISGIAVVMAVTASGVTGFILAISGAASTGSVGSALAKSSVALGMISAKRLTASICTAACAPVREKCCVLYFSPPAKKASPSNKSRLPRIDPVIDARAIS